MNKEQKMKFWKVTVYNNQTLEEETFVVASDNEPGKIAKILSSVHPEWEKIDVKTTKKPKGFREWGTS